MVFPLLQKEEGCLERLTKLTRNLEEVDKNVQIFVRCLSGVVLAINSF